MELWKKLVILTFVLLGVGIGIITLEFFFFPSNNLEQRVQINTILDSSQVTLFPPVCDSPYGLDLEIRGDINEYSKVWISYSDTSWQANSFELKRDSLGFKYIGDWYHCHAILKFLSLGELKEEYLISYTFYQ